MSAFSINPILMVSRLRALLVALMLSSCSLADTGQERTAAARTMIANAHWQEHFLDVNGVTLFSAAKITNAAMPARLYIEGDGYAFTNSSQISSDPTPRPPMLLTLALADESPNTIYVARPCQYLLSQSPACSFRDWSFDRFNALQVARISQLLDDYRQTTGIRSFELVGYSGGAAIALTLAATRNDVASVRTIAGNVALAEFIRMHSLESFATDADPMRNLAALKRIPQIHLVSSGDSVIRPELVKYYLTALSSSCAKSMEVDSPTHGKGWEAPWRDALRLAMPDCSAAR